MKSKWTEQRDQYFTESFSHYLKLWHRENPKENTQGELARRICEIREEKGKEPKVTASYISEWKRGKWFPEAYLDDIADAFGIDVEKLTPSTRAEQYRVSSDYTTELGRKLLDKACDSFGLDVAFLDAVRSLFGSEFKDVFPLWTPIVPTGSIMGDPYTRGKRSILAGAADAEGQVAARIQLQVEIENEDGETENRTVFLSEPDLIYLSDVQKDVKDYVEFLFQKRKKEMGQEVERAITAAVTEKNGVTIFAPINHDKFDKYLQKAIEMQPHRKKGE